MDAILHTCASSSNPTETEIRISTSREELVNRCGLRYAISRPLSSISTQDAQKKFVFMGKRCGLTALKNYQKINTSIVEMIPITMSFFCTGLPSIETQKLLKIWAVMSGFIAKMSWEWLTLYVVMRGI